VDRGVAVILTAVMGGLVAMQPPINAGLARVTGSFPAAFVSFLVGTILLGGIVVALGKTGDVGSALDVNWYYLLGGFLGMLWVTTVLITVKTIGAGGVAAATITGQLTAAVVLDRVGFLGLDEVALTPLRLLGVAMLLAGTYLIVR
jgi:transporter family-2 protein